MQAYLIEILKRTEKSFLVLLTLSCHCHFQNMASTISLLPEKHFLCSLCRDIFTSPVTIPCGHSFCLSCLSHYWTRHQSKYCPHCKRLFTDRPDLSVNRILAEVSHNYRTARPQKPPDEEMVLYCICQFFNHMWSNKCYIQYNIFVNAYVTVTGYRCWANDSGKAAEDRKVEIFSRAPKGASENSASLKIFI